MTTRGFSQGCTGLKSLWNQRLKARRRLSKAGCEVFCQANRTGTQQLRSDARNYSQPEQLDADLLAWELATEASTAVQQCLAHLGQLGHPGSDTRSCASLRLPPGLAALGSPPSLLFSGAIRTGLSPRSNMNLLSALRQLACFPTCRTRVMGVLHYKPPVRCWSERREGGLLRHTGSSAIYGTTWHGRSRAQEDLLRDGSDSKFQDRRS